MNISKNFKNLDRYTKWSIIIIILGIILRFYLASVYHVAGDACWQLSNSRFIAENKELPLFEQFGRDEPFWPPPLFHIAAAFVYIIFKNLSESIADFAVRMISPVLGSLTLIFFFLISKNLFNNKIAFYSLAFMAFIPLSLDYSVFSYIDGPLIFLIVLSVYFALENRLIASSIVAGLVILTKYNGVFILPVLAYIVYMKNNDNKRLLIKNLAIVFVISLAISSIWFIRNWVYLGNPVWPFMNSIFHGFEIKTFTEAAVGSVNLLNIFKLEAITSIYLGVYGVPDGNISTLGFFNIPYMNILVIIWVLSTIIFSIPFIFGLFSKMRHKSLLAIWILSYMAVVMLYVVNASWSVARFLLPAFPAVALIWASGFEKMQSIQIRKIFNILTTIVIIGFVFTSFVKITLAANSWNAYKKDFDWIKANTEKNALFLTGAQCVSYNINRQTFYPEVNNIDKADYVFVNQDFKLDRRAILNQEVTQELSNKSAKLAYENKNTGTKVYKKS